MATKSEPLTSTISERLVATCRQILDDIILAPSVQIGEIDLEVLRSPHFDSEEPTTSYVITVSTNDATMVRGAVASYKGSYKERVEAVLDQIVKQEDPNGYAYVNISGPERDTVDRLFSIQSLIDGKKLLPTAPIIRTAKQNGIDYIQIRGRHLIAPSPAIAEFLQEYALQHPGEIRTVADLFAGTAVATRVLLRTASPQKIVVIDNDPQKIRKIREQIRDRRVTIRQGNALRWSIVEKFDLLVADPYYEDVFEFIVKQIHIIRRKVGILILVPGNIEDRIWNTAVHQKLQSSGFNVVLHEMYGQVILEAKPILHR